MKVTNKIELEFAGVTLPVVLGEEGHEMVPAKPIIEAVGAQWRRQWERMQTPYLTRRLGVCVVQMYYAGQSREMVCIRLNRVTALLNQLNPESVRSAGNEAAADFLEAKQAEWDDLIHEYETRKGGMLQAATREQSLKLRLYLAVLREKRATSDAHDRASLSAHARALSAAAGIPYQADLIDDAGDAPA